MPVIPIRELGGVGVIPDRNPYDTPMNAFTKARNVRFAEDNIVRAPGFKHLSNNVTPSGTPMGVLDGSGLDGANRLVMVSRDGSVQEVLDGTLRDVGPNTPIEAVNQQVTTAKLAGITYFNVETDNIFRRSDPAGQFVRMGHGWENTETAKFVGAYKDFLVTLNITKDETEYPNMVKWSDAAQFNQVPSMAVGDDSSLSGETILNPSTGVLVCALGLGDSYILYGSKETFRMEYTGSDFVFDFSTLFTDLGIINKNCVTSANNMHFVFGSDDIWVHDGMTKQSIAAGRIKRYIFSRIDFSMTDRCFVVHDQNRDEILFCYPSTHSDPSLQIEDTSGCNEAAVYNYRHETWSVIDLPGTTCATRITLPESITWDDLTDWNDEDATWAAYAGVDNEMPLFGSDGAGAVSPQVVFYDDIRGGRLTNPLRNEFTWTAYVEASYKDLDALGTEILGRKMVKSIHPQIKTVDEDTFVTIRVGQSRNPSMSVVWSNPKDFLPWEHEKYDTRTNGRYITMRFEMPQETWAEVSGFDLEIIPISKR